MYDRVAPLASPSCSVPAAQVGRQADCLVSLALRSPEQLVSVAVLSMSRATGVSHDPTDLDPTSINRDEPNLCLGPVRV